MRAAKKRASYVAQNIGRTHNVVSITPEIRVWPLFTTYLIPPLSSTLQQFRSQLSAFRIFVFRNPSFPYNPCDFIVQSFIRSLISSVLRQWWLLYIPSNCESLMELVDAIYFLWAFSSSSKFFSNDFLCYWFKVLLLNEARQQIRVSDSPNPWRYQCCTLPTTIWS